MTGPRFPIREPDPPCAGWLMHNRQDCDCYADDRALDALLVSWRRVKRVALLVFIGAVSWSLIAAIVTTLWWRR